MDKRKVQIWLRPDQVDLLREILAANHAELDRGVVGKLGNACISFCARRVAEILAMLPNPDSHGTPPR